MAKILLTGGAGYVGSRLVPALLAQNYEVRVLDNLMYGQTSLLPYFFDDRFEFIRGDIRDERTIKNALRGVDLLIYLAAIVGAPACKHDPQLAKAVNQDATILLSTYVSDSQGLIYASTGSNYGAVDGICTEDTLLNPLSEYGVTKTAAERALWGRKNVIICRYATAFGLSERLRLDLMVNDLTFQAIRNKQLVVYEADYRRTFIHVYDIARSIIHMLKFFNFMSGEIYNVGHECMNLTKRSIVAMIQEKVKCLVTYASIGSDPDQRDYEVSYGKIRATGFETKVGLEAGIDELVKAYPMINQEGIARKQSLHHEMTNVRVRSSPVKQA